jgi:hypothetical protein
VVQRQARQVDGGAARNAPEHVNKASTTTTTSTSLFILLLLLPFLLGRAG